jgi:ATP-dependent phosphoenolpyruvate carboxykinase
MSNVSDTVKKAKSAKQVKQEADQAFDMDLDLTAKFESGRQIAFAEGRAILSGYHQGKLELAEFIKAEILSSPVVLKSATYEVRSLPPSENQSSIRAFFYGDENE